MALTSQYTDTTEPAADVDIEAATNAHLYGVISGCAVTFDATDMTYDVAAGQILHNGSIVAVAAQANAGTLVADGTNPRWATIYLDSTGTEGLVHGTAAADPSKPETGDNVAIAMVLIAAGATIASAQTTLDKRVMTHGGPTLVGINTSEQTTTSTSAVDLVTISGLSITVDQPIRIVGNFRKDASAANAVHLGLKLNSTVVLEAAAGSPLASSSGTQQAESGIFELVIGPRSANYLSGWWRHWHSVISATGATANVNDQVSSQPTLTALFPNATITSITIRGINATANNNLAVKDVRVYAG